jgi:DNA-binding response OmpR family regulator
MVRLLSYALAQRSIGFHVYMNGREALDALLELDVGSTKPLVLLDIDLPGRDGFAVQDELMARRPNEFRVVFLSSRGGEEEQLRALRAGAIDYLVKPVSIAVATAKIERWVGGGRRVE